MKVSLIVASTRLTSTLLLQCLACMEMIFITVICLTVLCSIDFIFWFLKFFNDFASPNAEMEYRLKHAKRLDVEELHLPVQKKLKIMPWQKSS